MYPETLIDALTERPDWYRDAPCAQTDPELFFPEKGGSVRWGKYVCEGCDVRAECLKYALDNREEFGIWGGVTARERRDLLEPRTKPVPPPTPLSPGKTAAILARLAEGATIRAVATEFHVGWNRVKQLKDASENGAAA